MNVDFPQGRLVFGSRPGGDAPKAGVQTHAVREAIEAVEVALARQELLATANASNPVGRAVILRLRAFTAERGACEERYRREPAHRHPAR